MKWAIDSELMNELVVNKPVITFRHFFFGHFAELSQIWSHTNAINYRNMEIAVFWMDWSHWRWRACSQFIFEMLWVAHIRRNIWGRVRGVELSFDQQKKNGKFMRKSTHAFDIFIERKRSSTYNVCNFPFPHRNCVWVWFSSSEGTWRIAFCDTDKW